jgi:hypothetical protein
MGLFGFFETKARKRTKQALKAISEGRAEIFPPALRRLETRNQKEMNIIKDSLKRKAAAQAKAKRLRKKRKQRKPGVAPGRGTTHA